MTAPVREIPRLSELRMQLSLRDSLSIAGLHDEGFSSTPANIALSQSLVATFEIGSRPVTNEVMNELGVSTIGAWDRAASNLIDSAMYTAGIRFLMRPARATCGQGILNHFPSGDEALEFGSPAGPITAWLAHPKCFSIFHKHVCELFGSDALYLVRDDTLIAVPDRHPSWLVPPADSFSLFKYNKGYPIEVSQVAS